MPVDASLLNHADRECEDTFARLVAASVDKLRVAVIGRGGGFRNRYVERKWSTARAADRPYCVYLAVDGLYMTLAFDLDGGAGTDVGEDADRLSWLLNRAGVAHVRVISGPTGGQHLLARFPRGVPAGRVAALARRLKLIVPSLDISPLVNAVTGAIRPPLSPHRRGGRSELLTPFAEAVAVLRQGNDSQVFSRLCAVVGLLGVPGQAEPTVVRGGVGCSGGGVAAALVEARYAPLSENVARLQRHGDVTGRYATRSNIAYAVAVGYVNSGQSLDGFVAAARDVGNLGLAHLREEVGGSPRSDRELQRLAVSLWVSAQRFVADHPPSARMLPLPAGLLEVQAAVEAVPERWGGQGGPTDRAVLTALCATAARVGTLEISASGRQLAELSGVSHSAADRGLQRLCRDGWLEHVERGSGSKGSTFRLRVPAGMDSGGPLDPAPLSSEAAADLRDLWQHTVLVQKHAAMTWEGLGRYAARVWLTLRQGASDSASLARRAGLARRTVVRHLRRLQGCALVSADATGRWTCVGEPDLDGVACELGCEHVVAERVRRHALERLLYRWYRADFRARRGWAVERGLWVQGRTRMRGSGQAVPNRPYPRHQGRASWVLAERAASRDDCPDTRDPAMSIAFG